MKNSIVNNIKVTNNLLKGSSSYHLDFIRGVAAILVLINHFRNIFFVKFEDIDYPNIFLKLLYSFAGLGHQAVIVFFVLSGFFISNSVLTNVYKNNWSWKYYLINRFTRLYVVLIPVLLIGFILDVVGSNVFDYSFFPRNIESNLKISVLFGNLFFLQEIFVPVLGSNGPLWSLSYEFWYYILFPCLLFIFVNRKSKFKVIIYCIFTILLALVLGIRNIEILSYFLIWLLGALILVSPPISFKRNRHKILVKLLVFLSFIATLGISRLGLISSVFVGDLLLSITFSVLIYITIHLKTSFNIFLKLKPLYYVISKKIAGFSFTLYLFHYPLLIFLFAFISNLGVKKMQPTFINLLYGAFICLAVILVTYLLSVYTEGKTNRVRVIVVQMLSLKKNATNSQSYKKAN
ncbi:peptidoglycan/LPS O-acetylase OafA/YrhL [Peribacillus frigoritolerans]|uniref:acyltransferase family protein n=1 Tax=Peribacillus frigoritolerans TaxID=450367 RepID=UPI00119B9733|nr:acyltransferase [Peribacillus frigoritolerans]TWE04162.1 peptidoglycan/LPS O-acetylase OafA/YrhL [Peribacillus frigoritolerans]